MLSARKIFEYIKNSSEHPIANVDELIEEALDALLERKLGELERAEHIEDVRDGVLKEIRNYIERCRKEGITPEFEFGHDPRHIKKLTDIHEARKKFLSWVFTLPPIQFEHLCRKVLLIEGCRDVTVTPPSGDGGVDFYGKKVVQLKDTNSVFRDVEVLVIGQAKRYENPIGVEELRSFVGAYNMIQIAEYKGAPSCLNNPITAESFRPLSPALLVFISSGEANNNTKELASWLGVRFIGGKELADIFFTHNVGFRRLMNGVEFDPSAFDSY